MTSHRVTPNRISVITAVLPAGAEHLHQAGDSISAQQLPDGWSVEWCLQFDGPGELTIPEPLNPVALSLGRSDSRNGPAIARNLALGRATGSLIKTLDADDQLTPGQLMREIEVFERRPDVQWVTSKAWDLFEDGSTVSFDADPIEGPLAPRSVGRYWSTNHHSVPVHPATLCMRRAAVAALGGWMALPASEDMALLLALDALWPGYFLATAGLLYRKWPGQLTVQDAHVSDENRRAGMAAIEARLDALDLLR